MGNSHVGPGFMVWGEDEHHFMSDRKSLVDNVADVLKLGALFGASNGVIFDAGCSLPQMLVP